MSQFQLFDSVKLREPIPLKDGGSAPEGTPGAIVEVLKDGEAYLVELLEGGFRQILEEILWQAIAMLQILSWKPLGLRQFTLDNFDL